MNYLLQDFPVYQLVEVEQINILVGLIAILGSMGILYLIVNALFSIKKRKKGGKK